MPSPGVIHAFSVPGGPGVRVDSYAHSECTVSPYYDSLIAKIITYGRDRTEAIARMRRTLEMTVVDGIKTSIPLHLKILNDPDFVAGRLSTSFMERFMKEKPARPAERAQLAESALTSSFDRSVRARDCARRLYRHSSTVDLDSTCARGLEPVASSRAWLDAGVRLVQLRAKTLASGRVPGAGRRDARRAPRGRARRSSSTTAPTSRGMAGAAGVHVGQTDLPPADARALVGPDAESSGSRRTTTPSSTAAMRRAGRLRGDRRRCFRRSIKGPAHPTVGTGVRARRRGAAPQRAGRPLVAIGGITLETASDGDRRGRGRPSP